MARKWSNLSLPGALHFVTGIQATHRFQFPVSKDGHQVWQQSFKSLPLWSGSMIRQKINYTHANPVKGRLVKTARDYYWTSFRSFHYEGDEPLGVDHEWCWPDDAEKFSMR